MGSSVMGDEDDDWWDSLSPMGDGDEVQNALETMKRNDIFKPLELAAYLNTAINDQRHATLLEVVNEFFSTHPGERPPDVEAYINESITRIRDLAGPLSGFQWATVEPARNILRVENGPNYIYFMFIGYAAYRRGVTIDAPEKTRGMEICFSAELVIREGESSLLLVDLIRTRNRGRLYYPSPTHRGNE
jgi:hypothetical protein